MSFESSSVAATNYYTTLTSNAVSAYCDGTIRWDQLAGLMGLSRWSFYGPAWSRECSVVRIIDTSYDPATRAMLNRVLDEVWSEVEATLVAGPIDTVATRGHLALRIIRSANDGERDPARLKSIALRGVTIKRAY